MNNKTHFHRLCAHSCIFQFVRLTALQHISFHLNKEGKFITFNHSRNDVLIFSTLAIYQKIYLLILYFLCNCSSLISSILSFVRVLICNCFLVHFNEPSQLKHKVQLIVLNDAKHEILIIYPRPKYRTRRK